MSDKEQAIHLMIRCAENGYIVRGPDTLKSADERPTGGTWVFSTLDELADWLRKSLPEVGEAR